MSARLVAALGVLALLTIPTLAACGNTDTTESTATAWVEIRGTKVAVEVAATPEAHTQGLSGRSHLEHGTGMLFLYETADFQRFWMIDMNFSIDMVWIRDGRIVGVHHSVPLPEPGTPARKLPRYGLDELVDSVLEVPAGYARSHGWARGDAVAYGGEALNRPEAL